MARAYIFMGTIYSVACRDCKITRNLDKFYSLRTVATRADALKLAEDILECDSFRAALLSSFMWDHKGHNCTVLNEHDDELSIELDPYFKNAKADTDYWKD